MLEGQLGQARIATGRLTDRPAPDLLVHIGATAAQPQPPGRANQGGHDDQRHTPPLLPDYQVEAWGTVVRELGRL